MQDLESHNKLTQIDVRMESTSPRSEIGAAMSHSPHPSPSTAGDATAPAPAISSDGTNTRLIPGPYRIASAAAWAPPPPPRATPSPPQAMKTETHIKHSGISIAFPPPSAPQSTYSYAYGYGNSSYDFYGGQYSATTPSFAQPQTEFSGSGGVYYGGEEKRYILAELPPPPPPSYPFDTQGLDFFGGGPGWRSSASSGGGGGSLSPTTPLGVFGGSPTSPVPRSRSQSASGCLQSLGMHPPQLADLEPKRIFIWDLDETAIIFNSLLNGTYARKFGKDPGYAHQLGLRMEELIMGFADASLFYKDLEECDQVHIDDVANEDNQIDLTVYDFNSDGFRGSSANMMLSGGGSARGSHDWFKKLAYRYRRIKEIYQICSANPGSLLSPPKFEQWRQLCGEIAHMTDNWISLVLKCLAIVNEKSPGYVNVLVTTTALVPTLAKALLHDLGHMFPVENVYSAAKVGKDCCFERISARFGSKCTYIVVGDGAEEESASKKLGLPFWRIQCHSDLHALHFALKLGHL